jgi:hypothetical protein
MNFLRSHPSFATALGVCGLLTLGGIGCLIERTRTARQALAQLDQKKRELRALAGLTPAPNEDNAAQIERDRAQAAAALAALRMQLRGSGPAAERLRQTPAPGSPSDAYFELADFVERMRAQAAAAGVALAPDERFGFAAYAHAGPEPERIAAVHRQRLIVQTLLEALFAAQPRRLLSVQRGRPASSAPAGRDARGPAAGNQSADTFEPDPALTALVPGYVEATAFRLVFDGPTDALRSLLNRLAAFELPLVVRAVEVEPAGAETHDARATTDSARPLVPSADSRFTVTVEWIDLVASAPAA